MKITEKRKRIYEHFEETAVKLSTDPKLMLSNREAADEITNAKVSREFVRKAIRKNAHRQSKNQ